MALNCAKLRVHLLRINREKLVPSLIIIEVSIPHPIVLYRKGLLCLPITMHGLPIIITPSEEWTWPGPLLSPIVSTVLLNIVVVVANNRGVFCNDNLGHLRLRHVMVRPTHIHLTVFYVTRSKGIARGNIILII